MARSRPEAVFFLLMGFEAHPLGETLAHLSLGPHAFLLQGYYVKEWAENAVRHVLVDALGPHRSLRFRSFGRPVAFCPGHPVV
jgi:hypothetical protein